MFGGGGAREILPTSRSRVAVAAKMWASKLGGGGRTPLDPHLNCSGVMLLVDSKIYVKINFPVCCTILKEFFEWLTTKPGWSRWEVHLFLF